jgi:hypothetical protein
MRRFPKAAAVFQEIVNQRGQRLRQLPYDVLAQMAGEPLEHVTVESRPATIGLIVQREPPDKLRVVLQGFLKSRWLGGHHVALDGFYKARDGSVLPMPEREFHDYD